MNIARAEFRHKLTNTVTTESLLESVLELVTAAGKAFPALPLQINYEPRHSSLHLFVLGHPQIVTMFKVRLLYRGWKLVGRIRISEEVSVRPTVSRNVGQDTWVSVASPAYNTREPLAAPMWYVPKLGEQSNTEEAQVWANRRSADRYGLGQPYGQVAAHVAALAHNMKASPEVTPSPERTPYETHAQYKQRKHRAQTMRNFEKRRAAILAVYEAQVEEKMQAAAAAAASGKKTNGRRTTRKQTGA